MFDRPKNSNSFHQVEPPVNLPTDDFLPESEKKSQEKPVEDILAQVEPAKAGSSPLTPLKKEESIKITPPVAPFADLPEEGSSELRGKIITALVVIIALGLVAFGGWLAYSRWFKGKSVSEKINTAGVNIGPEKTQPVVNANTNIAPVNNVNTFLKEEDFDHDGLADNEEKELGTDPRDIDSDNDGLFDREEVKLYKTDPLKPDTDSDGYRDGEEVKNGYNPKGPGKLLEISQ